MTANPLEQMSTHLQFLGYEISREGELLAARHQTYPNILIRPFAGGILFTSPFECSDNAKKNRIGYLEFINALNEKAAVARFYADQDSDFFIEAWYPDYYERGAFGLFIDKWNRDFGLLSQFDAINYLQ